MRRSVSVFRFLLWTFLAATAVIPCLAENPRSIHAEGYVTDLARVLSADERARLENFCEELHRKTGAQMAIVTVNSLEGMSSSAYAHELFNALGVGDRTRNDGVLILIAPKEHKYWTSVGRGLETVITRELATDSGKEMTPYFRRGEFGAGIEIAARKVGSYVAQSQGIDLEETTTAATVATPVHKQSVDDELVWNVVIGVVVFAVAIFFLVLVLRWIAANAGTGTGYGGYQGPAILSQPRTTWWNNQTYYGGDCSTWGGFGGCSNQQGLTNNDAGIFSSSGSGWSSGGDSGFSGFDGGSSSCDSGGGGSW